MPADDNDGSSNGAGSMNALSVSPLMKGSVSSEKASASSSAYTSNSRGKFSKPSATCCIVLLGDSENVGTWTSLNALPEVRGRLAFGSPGVAQRDDDA